VGLTAEEHSCGNGEIPKKVEGKEKGEEGLQGETVLKTGEFSGNSKIKANRRL